MNTLSKNPALPNWSFVVRDTNGYSVSEYLTEEDAKAGVDAYWLSEHGETPEQFLDACLDDFRSDDPDEYPEGVSGVEALGMDFFYDTLASGHGIQYGQWVGPNTISYATGGSATFEF